VVPDVAEDHYAFIVRVKQPGLTMKVKAQQSFEMSADTHPKDSVISQMICIFKNTAVRTTNLI